MICSLPGRDSFTFALFLTDLTDLGLWSEDLKNEIIAAGGSIQGVASIPDDLKALYKTVWEIKQKVSFIVHNS